MSETDKKESGNSSQKSSVDKNTPESLKDGVKTVIRKFSDVVKAKLDQLEDLATLEVRLPVGARLKHRLESIRKISQARNLKIDGKWKTIPPQIHITNLHGKKINNDEIHIKFSVFEMDNDGNKILHENKTTIVREDGSKIERVTSAEYRIAYEVTEKIVSGKPITRELLYINK